MHCDWEADQNLEESAVDESVSVELWLQEVVYGTEEDYYEIEKAEHKDAALFLNTFDWFVPDPIEVPGPGKCLQESYVDLICRLREV